MIKLYNAYNLRLLGTTSIIVGAFLLAEHVYRWGFEIGDIIGHEYLGLILILFGVGMGILSRKE